MDITAYRRRCEEFVGALDLEHYLHYSGQKEDCDSASVYRAYADIVTREVRDELEATYQKAKGHDDRWRLAYLVNFITEAFIGEQVKELGDRLAELEATSTVSVDGEEIPYRYASVLQANEPDRARRRRIFEGRQRVLVEKLNPLHDEYWRTAHAVTVDLGYTSYEAMFGELKGMNHGLFRGEMEALLQDTDFIYERALSALVEDRLGLSLSEIGIWDMPYLFRAPQYDQYFTSQKLVPTLRATLAGLGIDLQSQTNVHMDTEVREQKSPRAFCAPVKVPDEIYLCVMPQGGQDDYQALLHEAGHTEHFAHVDPELPFEYRYLGDNAVTEAFAFLFDHLTHDPHWLAHYLGYRDSEDYVRFANISDLYFLRRYIGKYVYELRLHNQNGSLDGMAGLYHDKLTAATLVDVPSDWYLTDVDDAFYVVSYLRAWMLEAALREMLQSKFGPEWFTQPGAGDWLRRLWSWGQTYTSPKLLLKIDGGRLDADPLKHLMNKVLGLGSGLGL